MLLAQCGLAAPCAALYVPHYRQIQLLTCAKDAPNEGRSTHRVETDRLATVYSCPQSLVLADEIGHSTDEDPSAHCVLRTLIDWAVTSRSALVLATHTRTILDYASVRAVVTRLQIDRTHRLRPGVCLDVQARQSAVASHWPAAQMACYDSKEPRTPWTEPLPAPRAPAHPAVDAAAPLLDPLLGGAQPHYVGEHDQVPAGLLDAHVLYLRVRHSAPQEVYVGESRNELRRAQEHRRAVPNAVFYVYPLPASANPVIYEDRVTTHLKQRGFSVVNRDGGTGAKDTALETI